MRCHALLFACLLAACGTAHADTFSYQLTTYGSTGFTATVPYLVTTDLRVSPTTCTAAYLACDGVEIDATDSLVRYYIHGQTALSENLPASFFTAGTHSTYYGTSTITDIPSPTQAPEPSSVALFGTGLLGLVGALKRHLA